MYLSSDEFDVGRPTAKSTQSPARNVMDFSCCMFEVARAAIV